MEFSDLLVFSGILPLLSFGGLVFLSRMRLIFASSPSPLRIS